MSDWIKWSGGQCPVSARTRVEVMISGNSTSGIAEEFHWYRTGTDADITDYRVVRVDDLVLPVRDLMTPEQPTGVGDVNSDAKGSGARYNTGKLPFELIPLHLVGASYNNFEDQLEGEPLHASFALKDLGYFQAGGHIGHLYVAMHELGLSSWDDCARVFDYGRRKYSAHNWAKGMAWSIPIACAARHLLAIIRGETNDPESGLPHRGHVMCNLVMLLTYTETYKEGDDRPKAGLFAPEGAYS